MKKLLGLLCAGAMVAMMSGCGINSPVEAPKITIDNNIGSIAIPSSNSVTKTVTGKITADTAISAVTYSITKGSGTASGVTVTGTAANNENSLNFTATITISSTADSGAYKLSISATAGPTADASFDFTLTGGNVGPTLTEKSVTLGAQNANPPSCLDADNMTAYSNTTTDASIQANIDIIFSYSTVLNPAALAFTSPSVAQGAPYDSWTNKAAAEYKAVTATWADITTQENINSLWGSGAGDTRLAVSQGDIIIVKTSAGAYKAIQITSVNGTNGSAEMDIKGKY